MTDRSLWWGANSGYSRILVQSNLHMPSDGGGAGFGVGNPLLICKGVDSGEPKESGLSPEPLRGAERVFEEHEGDLVEKVIALVQRGIPPKATVREAMAEMQRAMREDPDVNELVQSLFAMKLYGGGKVVDNWPEWWRANRPID